MQHLVVSLTGSYGFVGRVLAEHGRSRRIALTVPNFMFALAVIAETDLISALPGRFQLNAVASKVAMIDLGLTWLCDVLGRAEHG
jgi:hypothetical protein